MAANPANRLARRDVRLPAGANPEVPGFAKGDHVLHKWVLEERARRRRFLADQVLEPNEPLPRVKHPHPIFKPLVNMFDSLDRATGYRAKPIARHAGFVLGIFAVPIWYLHYKTKYHWQGTNKLLVSKPVVYPDKDIGEHGHHH